MKVAARLGRGREITTRIRAVTARFEKPINSHKIRTLMYLYIVYITKRVRISPVGVGGVC